LYNSFYIDLLILFSFAARDCYYFRCAVRAYYEKLQSKDRTPKEVHDVMTQAVTAATKGFQIEFDKQSTVANPKNDVGFLEEVCNSIYMQINNFHVYFEF
jgi:hypothetical protein